LTGEGDFLTPAGWKPLKQGAAQTDDFGRPVPSPTTSTPAVRRPANSPTPSQSER
jgi:hypothetical protein